MPQQNLHMFQNILRRKKNLFFLTIRKFSKIIKKKIVRFKKKLHTFQTISTKKKLFLFRNNFFFKCRIYFFLFFLREALPPASPTGAVPLYPACFWIADRSRNRFALNGVSAKYPNIFFFFKKKIYFS